MSRGRGGTSREHYQRYPRPHHPQAKENYHRPEPFPHHTGGSPQHDPVPSYYYSPPRPVVPPQPPAHSFLSSCPPSGNHNKDHIPPKPGESSSFNTGHNSFHYQQLEFLRGQRFEAPQFTAAPQSEEEDPARFRSTSYQLQPGYHQYPRASCQDRCLPSVRPSRVPPDPRRFNKSHPQDPELNLSRQQHVQTGGLAAAFHHLSLTQRWPKRGGDRLDRRSASGNSANFRLAKANIVFTPDVQEQVLRALAALKPSDRIPAKWLAKKLHLPKTIVNKALYSLERAQKAFKQGLSPPLWTAYREQRDPDRDQDSLVDSQTSHPTPRENSDTESSSSPHSWSVASSDCGDSKVEGESQHPVCPGSSDQERSLSKMPEQKELVLNHLFNSGETTALCIAKNLGFKTAKQINPTLYSLEKQGDVIKHGEVTPPTWELATHRRERMERTLKAAQSAAACEAKMETENEGGGSVLVLQPAATLLPTPNLHHLPLQDRWLPRQDHSQEVANIITFAAKKN